MLKLNEDVIHKTAGACYVANITTSNFGIGEQQYYVLKPRFPTTVNKTLEIFVPVEKEAVLLRKPVSSSDVLHLISIIPELEDYWLGDAKARKQKFEEIYREGNIRRLCSLVKLLYVNPPLLTKPMSITDKTFLTKIRVNVFDEFAIALKLKPEEIEPFIMQRAKKEL